MKFMWFFCFSCPEFPNAGAIFFGSEERNPGHLHHWLFLFKYLIYFKYFIFMDQIHMWRKRIQVICTIGFSSSNSNFPQMFRFNIFSYFNLGQFSVFILLDFLGQVNRHKIREMMKQLARMTGKVFNDNKWTLFAFFFPTPSIFFGGVLFCFQKRLSGHE